MLYLSLKSTLRWKVKVIVNTCLANVIQTSGKTCVVVPYKAGIKQRKNDILVYVDVQSGEFFALLRNETVSVVEKFCPIFSFVPRF